MAWKWICSVHSTSLHVILDHCRRKNHLFFIFIVFFFLIQIRFVCSPWRVMICDIQFLFSVSVFRALRQIMNRINIFRWTVDLVSITKSSSLVKICNSIVESKERHLCSFMFTHHCRQYFEISSFIFLGKQS